MQTDDIKKNFLTVVYTRNADFRPLRTKIPFLVKTKSFFLHKMITNCNKSAITLPGENGRLHYTIRESSRGNVFDVDMTSGEIYPALPVDYEKARSHWIIVQASDS